jgi:RNA polymerase sigma factor (sigma-70 family)
MSSGPADHLRSMLYRLATPGGSEPRADAELLARFGATDDEVAFRALVDRHGPLVWGVCSRILRHRQDAEDAFQATFVGLARKAADGTRIAVLPAWLHEVARRAALNIKNTARRRRELTVETMPDPPTCEPAEAPDLAAAPDEEVSRLPERLRQPVILCHLQNRTYAEAAPLLKMSVSTVCRRVEEGRDLLRERLTRRGLAPAGAAGVLLAGASAASAVPPGLAARTVKVAVAAGAATAPVGLAAVGDAAVKSMAGGKARLLGLLAVAALTASGGVGLVALTHTAAVPEAEPPAGGPAFVVDDGPLKDRLGDPLPAVAVARIGTLRFRADTRGGGDVAFLPGGRTLASVHWGPAVLFWDIATGTEPRRIAGPAGAQWLAVSADGKRLAAAGRTEVWVWDLTAAGATLRWKWKGETAQAGVTALAFAPDGATLAVADPAGDCVRLLRADAGKEFGTLDGCPHTPMAFAPDGKVLAALKSPDRSAGAGQLALWDVPAGAAADLPAGLNGQTVLSFAFSPDGKALATAGQDGTARVWDLATGREVATWPIGCPRPVLGYLSDGKTVAEFRSDRIVFRGAATGAEARPSVPAAELGILNSSAVLCGKRLSPDGRLFATGVTGGHVAVWDVATGREAGP